jgi:hypothetical protein
MDRLLPAAASGTLRIRLGPGFLAYRHGSETENQHQECDHAQNEVAGTQWDGVVEGWRMIKPKHKQQHDP